MPLAENKTKHGTRGSVTIDNQFHEHNYFCFPQVIFRQRDAFLYNGYYWSHEICTEVN